MSSKNNHLHVADTFYGELNRQCRSIIFFAVAISLTWLLYIPLDIKLIPNYPEVIYFRIGLPIVGLICLILYFIKKLKYRFLIALIFYSVYLSVATGVITGLSNGNSAYIGGLLFILMLFAIAPLPRYVAWVNVFLISFVCGFFIFFLKPQHSYILEYSLRDAVNVVVVASSFIYLLNNSRYKNWQQSIAVELEKDKSKKLLLNILPTQIASELEENGYVEPIYHKAVTVVFTDFVGFSWISEILDPQVLIHKLDDMFREFDRIVDKYHVEKLKTIGDSYMYAGGLPEDTTTHAIDAVLSALEIVRYVDQENKKLNGQASPLWEIRIGINTGGVMAGVVGEKKFIYDIWGDSVNIASRLETTGVTGKVNISHSTYLMVKDFFTVEPRGMISIKNKGEIEMYLATQIKPELSVDGEGLEPNQTFIRKYCLLRRNLNI